MRFRRGKSSSKAKKGSAAAAPWQNGERKVVVDGAGAGSNSRQVAPDTGFGDVDDGNALCSQCFQFLCDGVDHKVFFVLAFLEYFRYACLCSWLLPWCRKLNGILNLLMNPLQK